MIGDTRPITRLNQLQALVLRLCVGLLRDQLGIECCAGSQQIRHFAERQLNRLFVLGDGDDTARLGHIPIGGIPARIEQRQGQRGLEIPRIAARTEQAAQLAAGRTESPGQTDARQKGRARRADVGVGGDQPLLGGQDIRALQQHVTGYTSEQIIGYVLSGQTAPGGHFGGYFSHQHHQQIFGGGALALQIRLLG